ncbi:hypothetical protein PM082_007181 [Marasmius tenuissimus]|nr:hypothetical protein PM082_007181 [Marasmius tenuissimus]
MEMAALRIKDVPHITLIPSPSVALRLLNPLRIQGRVLHPNIPARPPDPDPHVGTLWLEEALRPDRMDSRRQPKQLPNELLERIFSMCGRNTRRKIILANYHFFGVGIRVLYKKIAWRTFLELFEEHPKFSEGPRAPLYANAVRGLIIGGTPDSLEGATEWKWDDFLAAISSFRHLQTISIDHVWLPVYLLPAIFAHFPKLERLRYRSPLIESYNFTPCRLPSDFAINPLSTNLTFLDVRNYAVQDRFGYMDEGVIALAAMSALPSLRILHTDVVSWDTLLRGRVQTGWSLPPSLRELVLHSKCWRLDGEKAGSLLKALESCTESLEILRVLTSNSIDLAHEQQSLYLPRLKEYVGLPGLIPAIGFPPDMETIWDHRWSRLNGAALHLLERLTCLASIRFLTIGSWDVTQYPLQSLLSRLPSLEELSLTVKFPITKQALLEMGPALALSPRISAFSVIRRPRQALANKAALKILGAWSDHAPRLEFVRFNLARYWIYESTGWVEDSYTGNLENRLFVPKTHVSRYY